MLKCSTCHKLLYDRKLQAARMQMLVALSYARECFLSRCYDKGDTGCSPNKRPEGALIYFYAKVRSLEEREEEDRLSRFDLH
jgi:hypothetical protein